MAASAAATGALEAGGDAAGAEVKPGTLVSTARTGAELAATAVAWPEASGATLAIAGAFCACCAWRGGGDGS